MEFHVRQKQDVGFTPKNHEKRTVPMPASLVNLLKERKKNAPRGRWIFINRQGRANRVKVSLPVLKSGRFHQSVLVL
jgi:integrase